MTFHRILLPALAMALAAPASAASVQDLTTLRDAIFPGQCPTDIAISAHEFDGGTLHQLSCGQTAQDSLANFIWESDDGLKPLFFPTAQLSDLGADRPNWGAMELTEFAATAMASSPVVEGNQITLSHRVAPGVGGGVLLHRYDLREGTPILESVSFSYGGVYDVALWPDSARADRLPPVPFTMQGYGEVTVDFGTYQNPLDVVGDLSIYFPAHPEEEGAPRMTVQMTQRSDTLAMEIEEKGWADDSVSGQAYRVLMQHSEAGWRVTGVGKANLCYRGKQRKTAGRCL